MPSGLAGDGPKSLADAPQFTIHLWSSLKARLQLASVGRTISGSL